MTTNAQPVIACWGAGRDSTAMIIERYRRGERLDAILHANTGSEKRETYEFIPVFQEWLRTHGLPPVTTVQYNPVRAPYTTLEGNMILNATLPGAAFNCGSCADKFKIQPQNRWTRSWRPAQQAWARGGKVIKLIGFEANENYRLKRADAKAHTGKANKLDRQRYEYQMPLMDWNIDLDGCIEIIKSAGLPVPPKSACYFCPNQQEWEVDAATPEDRARTILMEVSAEPYNTKMRGMWRKPRKSDGRPGSITEYILAKRLDFVPLSEIAPVVVLNDKCAKARTGVTLDGPHVGPTLREQLTAAGHYVPEVVTRDKWDGVTQPYQESRREAPAWIEYEAHQALVEAI